MRWRKASGSSWGRTTVVAVMPCLRALKRTRSFPSGVLGPVLFWALRRLASICFWVAIWFLVLCPWSVVRCPSRCGVGADLGYPAVSWGRATTDHGQNAEAGSLKTESCEVDR